MGEEIEDGCLHSEPNFGAYTGKELACISRVQVGKDSDKMTG